MFMLMLARRYRDANANLGDGRMGHPPGAELHGQRLGLLGFGESARALTRLVRPFGMEIAAVEIRDVPAEERRKFGLVSVRRPEELDELVAESDFLSLHLHLTEGTRHIIDARRIALMKPGSFLINIARGALVDERALADALESGRLGGAGLDVFEFEPPTGASLRLTRLPNVVATPHTAANTRGTLQRRGLMCLENLDRVAAGLEPKYRVA
jgi:phosphoglycerate dehydrogenase-like enzyme